MFGRGGELLYLYVLVLLPVLEMANEVQGKDVRVSEDAGRYLCDFIYFSSMAHLTRKEEERRVVFLHVPVNADEVAIENGIEITIELIRAMVQSDRMKKYLAAYAQ